MITAIAIIPRPTLRKPTIEDVLVHYRATQFQLSPRTHRFYKVTLQSFMHWYGGPIPLSELTDRLVIDWLTAERNAGRSARTINGKRTTVRVLWKEAYRLGLMKALPGEVPRMREPRRTPTSWSISEVERILAHCHVASSEGWERSKKAWSTAHWQSLVMVIYDSSCRIGTMLALPRDCVDINRRTMIVPGEFQKNGQDIYHRLHHQTCSFISQLRPHKLLFPWPKCLADVWTDFRRILKAAGLPATYRDQFHKLRRTSYTQTYKALGLAAATEHAGHREDLSAVYLDRTALGLEMPVDVLPRPRLGCAGQIAPEDEVPGQPVFPDPAEFEFLPTRLIVRGRVVPARGSAVTVLKAILDSHRRRVTFNELSRLVFRDHVRPSRTEARRSCIASCVFRLRALLRRALALPEDFDPVPCTRRGGGGEWSVRLPPASSPCDRSPVMRPDPPAMPRPKEWRFTSTGFEIRGAVVELGGPARRILEAIALAGAPVAFEAIATAYYRGHPRPSSSREVRHAIFRTMSHLRRRLISALGLPGTIDPIPFVPGGRVKKWTVCLPRRSFADVPVRRRGLPSVKLSRAVELLRKNLGAGEPVEWSDLKQQAKAACISATTLRSARRFVGATVTNHPTDHKKCCVRLDAPPAVQRDGAV